MLPDAKTMKRKSILLEAIQSAKWNLYIILLANGIFIQFFAPFRYKCNFTEEQCLTCGLRTAVNLFLHGHFLEAYQANKLIVVIVIGRIIMAVDVLHHLCKSRKAKERKSIQL